MKLSKHTLQTDYPMYKKTSKPLFSVVIPAYKRRDLVTEAIKSVLHQTNIPNGSVETIIPDDEDNPKERIKNKKYFTGLSPKIVYAVNKHEEGPGGNRQTGFDLVRGKYVVFLDSDDKLEPNFLFKMSSYLDKNKFIAVVCLSNSKFEKGFAFFEHLKLIPLTVLRDISLFSGYLFNKKSLYPPSFYLCQFSHMLFNANAIKGQKFNYDYRHGGEDWDFFVQTQKRGKIGIFPKKLIEFRYAPGSSTVDPKNLQNKWNSYLLLATRLPKRFKKGMFYQLFLRYIGMFGGKNTNKESTGDQRWDLRANNTITSTKLLLANLSIKVRSDQYKIFEKEIKPVSSSKVLDVGVTSDETIKDSNLFEKLYPHQNHLVAATIEDSKQIRKLYPKLNKVVLIKPHKILPFKKSEFDSVVSWATLEHVGDYKDQEFFLNELLRVGKKIFVTTPYRGALYEPHSGLPILHWLPLGVFRFICKKTGRKFWSSAENLNPLWTSDIKEMKLIRKIKIKIFKTFGILPTHIIITT